MGMYFVGQATISTDAVTIQEQVQTNKDLDLPTQQELLAQFRCDEISAAALAEFNEQAKSQKRPIEAGRVVEGLGALMKNWRDHTLGEFFPSEPIAGGADWRATQRVTIVTPRVTTKVYTPGNALTYTPRSPPLLAPFSLANSRTYTNHAYQPLNLHCMLR